MRKAGVIVPHSLPFHSPGVCEIIFLNFSDRSTIDDYAKDGAPWAV